MRRSCAAALLAALGLLVLTDRAAAAVELPVLVPGASCPTSGPINYQYLVTVAVGPNGAQPILSSNWTLAPFSATPVPVESIAPRTKEPAIPRVCDSRGRCIDAYELTAALTTLDVGFRNPATNQSVLSQFLTYDGTFPGPGFVMQQGVQALVRLHNHIFCNTTNMSPINSTGHFYESISALTLHMHGGASLSPFDGWTADNISPCRWKDYIYANQGSLEALWYHDHAMGITAQTVGCGLAGTYRVIPCNMTRIPAALRALYPPQYLVMSDNLFIQPTGAEYIYPAMFQNTVMADVIYNNATYSLTGLSGDHNFVNGLPWPVVTVQRKPYWFILHNGAQTRVFNVLLWDMTTNTSVNAMPGRFYVVGAEGGLRVQPVQASQGVILGAGERYQVVIDFSQFAVGTEIVMMNPPTSVAPYPYFCYTNLMMKFVVDGTEPRRTAFNPFYTYDPFSGDGQDRQAAENIEAACNRALNGGADVRMQTTTNSQTGENIKVFKSMPDTNEEWETAMVGDPQVVNPPLMRRDLRGKATDEEHDHGHEHKGKHAHGSEEQMRQKGKAAAGGLKRGGRGKRAGANVAVTATASASTAATAVGERRGLQVMTTGGLPFSQYLPHSLPTNGWSTWWMFNNVSAPGGGGVHPIHVHLINFYICGRRNQVTGEGIRDYETFSPKDIFFLGGSDEVAFITRVGPHQGSYMFHCHNLQHEDEGLMGQFNSTADRGALISNTTFWAGTLSAGRFGGGYSSVPTSPRRFTGEDPLVRHIPGNSIIGRNLYFAESMPPWAQREDPRRPGRPQPITSTLLQRVLARNYYEVFYPDSRRSLSGRVPNNPYAVMCPDTSSVNSPAAG